MSELEEDIIPITYRVITVALNKVHTDKRIIVNTKIVYFLSTPIATEIRLNKIGADKFNANSIQIIRAQPGQLITAIFVNTLTTSTSSMKILIADIDIFSDIGIEDRVVLLDTDGVEYDGRLRKSINADLDTLGIRIDIEVVGTTLDISSYDKIALLLRNTLNQSVSVQIEVSPNGTNYVDIGSPIVVSATTGLKVATLTDAWKFMRAKYICSVAPSSGTIYLYYNMK